MTQNTNENAYFQLCSSPKTWYSEQKEQFASVQVYI